MMYRWRKELWWLIILMVVALILYQITAIREEQEWQRAQEVQMHHETFEQIRQLEKQLDSLERRIDEFIHKWNISTFEATAYTLACGNGDGYTATMTVPQLDHTIAVDPVVVPLGSMVWIDGLGWRRAEDTGGAIRGERLDIYMASRSDAMQYGRQKVIVVWPSD